MSASKKLLVVTIVIIGSTMIGTTAPAAEVGSPSITNSWRGITPLRSSAADVARVIGADADEAALLSGPFRVDDGEVTFSYLTPSLAKIYRAPAPLVGKVFTIYFKPGQSIGRTDLKLGTGFKRCIEERDRTFYYMINDAGVAYQLTRDSDRVQTIIYQPSRAEVRRLAVNTDCVF
jgi:hypothetical protein